jgi:hypothetical protein
VFFVANMMENPIMMKKKLVSAAVSAALIGSLGAVQTANADSVLGPLFNTQDGVFTFASIITKQDRSLPPVPTHWIYLYKDLNNLTANCQHSDGDGRQTVNDLGTFFLGNNFAPGGTVFPDVDNTSTGFYIAPGFTGMFTVSNDSVSESSIAGEVLIADVNTGNVLSYRMINDPQETAEANFDDIAYGAFASQVVVDGGIPAAPVALWHRQSALSAEWFVMAPRDDMVDPTVPNLTLTISFAGNRPAGGAYVWDTGNYRIGFYYDRNENLRSTSKRVTFQCIARLSLDDFIDPGNLTAAENTGGWAHVEIVAKPPEVGEPPYHRDIGLLVYKLESSGGQSVWTSENRIDF